MGASPPFLLLGLVFGLLLSGCIAPQPDEAPPGGLPGTPTVANVTHERFEGRLVCGVGSPAGTANPCLFVEGSRNLFSFMVKPGIETLLVGMTWDPTSKAGESLQLLVETHGFSTVTHEDGHRYGSAAGKPDLVVRIDTAALDGEWSWEDLEGSMELQARVFPARTLPPSIVAHQGFEVHIVAFYGLPAPADADPFAEGMNETTAH